MNALTCIDNIQSTPLIEEDLRYCLVNQDKIPFTVSNKNASPNNVDDFVPLEELIKCSKIEKYKGVGISIQASKIWAIDIDHCFSIPNDINSSDKRAKEFLELFKDTYSEFSFSGTGLRILFKCQIINNYSDYFYIKNEKISMECYQPYKSFRYVTITGNCINNFGVKTYNVEFILKFLEKYMKKQVIFQERAEIEVENKTIEELFKEVKKLYRKNSKFQNLWFGQAPGSGSNESEMDYEMISLLYENITKDKLKIKEIFESSPYFKTKDQKHVYKWNNSNFRYFEYVYKQIRGTH